MESSPEPQIGIFSNTSPEPQIIYVEVVKYSTYTPAQKKAIYKYVAKPEIREKRRLWAQKWYQEKKLKKLESLATKVED